MSTRNGFPRMDWDTGFLADPKFQHLRDLLPDPIQFGYAGFCYLRLVADAWRTCQRRPIRDVVRGIEPWALTALREASLLEEDLVLSEASFDHWIGEALRGRETVAERVRKSREVTRTNAQSQEVTVGTQVARVGPVGQVEKTYPARATAQERPVLSVACPECQRNVGEPCDGVRYERNGDPWTRWAVHRSRWEVFNSRLVDQQKDTPEQEQERYLASARARGLPV